MIKIKHNIDDVKFKWLWAKYVKDVNLDYHCTNSLRGPYSKKFSKHNETFKSQDVISFDEVSDYSAIYICGVSSYGYSKKQNYPFNLHLALIPEENSKLTFQFNNWTIEIENAILSKIINEDELPDKFKELPIEFTTCRIFRWACTEGKAITLKG